MDEVGEVQKLAGALGGLDWLLVIAAVGLLFVIAYITGRKEEDTEDFFLGKRHVPGIIACLSFVATEISALTIVGVPATGFKENWQYLQFNIGITASRIFVAYFFIPMFYKYKCTTIYEYLKHRFGAGTQYTNSIFFFITRLLASGVRLYATCLAVAVIMGWSLGQAILFFSLVSMAFIAFGGIKAVVWTGAFETTMFFVAGLVLVGFISSQIQGGFAEAWRIAGAAGKLSVFSRC